MTGWAPRMRRAQRRAWSQAGLTLLEVVVALAIVAVLLAIAANGWSVITNRRLNNMARKIASDLRMLEQRARTERTCYRIEFRPGGAGGESYDILRFDGTVTVAPPGGGNQCTSAWPTTPAFIEETGDTASRRMPPRIDLVGTTFPANRVEFSPTGNPNAGTVTIRSDTGQEKQIVVDVMGRVRITP